MVAVTGPHALKSENSAFRGHAATEKDLGSDRRDDRKHQQKRPDREETKNQAKAKRT